MTSTQQLQLAPIPVSIDNLAEWEAIAKQIASETGEPTVVTPELIVGMIASAVPLLFAADASKDTNVLRETFTGPVIAQCQRNAGCLSGQRPLSAVVDLIGAPRVEGHTALRVHVTVDVEGADGSPSVNRQVWDLQLGAQVMVGQTTCPSCGAPLAEGELICGHCGTDVRSAVKVPLAVSRLELY